MKTVSIVGQRTTVLLSGADTAGQYSIIEIAVPPGSAVPPHVHHREDETFHVVSGALTFTVDSREALVSAGESLFGKRNVPHHFANRGDTEAILLVVVTPAGFENFFFDAGTPLTGRHAAPVPPTQADIRRLMEAAPKYGLEMLG